MVDSIQRITSALESARDLTFGAAAVASSRIGETSYSHYSKSIDPDALSRLLNSRNSRDVKDAMKRIMCLLATNDPLIDLKRFFADVLKNITSDDIKVRRMVCIYLLRFADSDPNLALLSVNSIQKSLSETSPSSRSLAIKALSDINVASLYPIGLQAAKKCITDSSPLVRASAAVALYKLFQEKPLEEKKQELLPLVNDLLSDSDPLVVSNTLIILKNSLPDRLELLHGHFRRYCDLLPSMTHLGQLLMVELLVAYSRKFITRPSIVDRSGESEDIPLPEVSEQYDYSRFDVRFDPDLQLLLDSLRPLLLSANPYIIATVSKAFFALSPMMTFEQYGIPEALIKASHLSCDEINCIILQLIAYYATYDQTAFIPYYKNFFPDISDKSDIGSYKLKILSHLITETNVKEIINELKYSITASDDVKIVKQSLNTLVICAHTSSKCSSHIMKWLLNFMESDSLNDAEVTSEYVNVIRHLIQINPSKNLSIMYKLSLIITETDNLSGYAKAGLVWLFGEYLHVEPRIVPDILRKLIPKFAYESTESRLQILILAAKLLSFDIDKHDGHYDFENSRISKLYDTVIYLAKFDDDFDIRDRARTFNSLFESRRFEILTLLLQAPKPWPALSLYSYGNKDKDVAPLNLPAETLNFFNLNSWEEITDVDRSPVEVKDYTLTKSSISSNAFFSRRTKPRIRSGSSSPISPSSPVSSTNTFTSSKGKTYKLASNFG